MAASVAIGVTLLSTVVTGQSFFSLYLMLYAWGNPVRLRQTGAPRVVLPPSLSFSVLLPARDEEAVIYDTIWSIWNCSYPRDLLEIIIICYVSDIRTIAEARRAIHDIRSSHIRVATFSSSPINKPHGLNVGLRHARGQVVAVFDAEDDVEPSIFSLVNTTMRREDVRVVQVGVQLMNFRDHWYSLLNCLEYFFWFKSRLPFHSRVGMIPLGGNTVFVARDLLMRVKGWDERCLTEDADLGLRLSVLGVPISVVYSAPHATREETPASTSAFLRQRTRWQQGFLQVLRKGVWLRYPRLSQRLLACYTLVYPFTQAILVLLWPVTVFTALWLQLSVLVVLISFVPLYALMFQYLASLAGARIFLREYGLKHSPLLPIQVAVAFLPFQWLQGLSTVRAVYRELRGRENWEKTVHVGAHRTSPPTSSKFTPFLGSGEWPIPVGGPPSHRAH
jgi:cellulose synthase/poly-beta-1,6-N-acetylglucosamine synthase-like glycosyltransferase